MLGAGIAGLACAIALARRGLSVEVIEQAAALAEIGAGLQIAPNGARVLAALGVVPRSLPSHAVHLIDGLTGRSVLRMPLGEGFALTHRADLVDALRGAATGAGVALTFGRRVASVEADRLIFADGSQAAFRRLVGADGARGAARTFVAPDHAAAQVRRFTGQVAWRAVVPTEGWPPEARVYMGPGRHLVCYPLRGERWLNLVAVEERADWVAEGWSATDDPANLRAAFAGFAAPVPAVLRRVETVHLWGLMDHGLAPRWTRGGIVLIGDAAHPTLPFLAQGANLALEDAWTLAARWDDPARWEAVRRPRVARALREARGNARNYHLRGVSRVTAHAALRILGALAPGAMLRRYRWLYDADVTARMDR